MDKVDFPNLYSDRFTPAMYTQAYIDLVGPLAGCGPNALSTLTHECPIAIREECKEMDPLQQRGTRDEIMLKFLEKRGIKGYRISDIDVAGSYSTIDRNILNAHVLLVSQRLGETFDSWFVYWNEHQFHNLVMGTFTLYEFLNRKPINTYVLHSPKWNVKVEHKTKAAAPRYQSIAERDQSGIVSMDIALQRVELMQQQISIIEAAPIGVSKRQTIAIDSAREALKNAMRELQELRLATREKECNY